MDIQNNKKIPSYLMLLAILSSVTIPGFAVYADTSETGNAVSGGAVVVPEMVEPTPKPNEKTKAKRKTNWKVKLKKVSRPSKLNCGTGFDVKGVLTSARKLKYVKAEIKNEKRKSLYKKKVKAKNKKKFDLNEVDDALKFSKLKKGNYVYQVTVTDQKNNSEVVLSSDFTVKQPKWMVPIVNPSWGDGWHCHCATHRGRHYGWDVRGGNKIIHAVADGTVVYAKYHNGGSLGSFGNLIIIYHGDGIYSYYAHCSKIKVKVGEKVTVGDVIGVTGSTGMAFGAHLHFELRKGPAFNGGYNGAKLVDKYTYRQFNPSKKIKR